MEMQAEPWKQTGREERAAGYLQEEWWESVKPNNAEHSTHLGK